MPLLSLFFILFGITVIAFPAFIAYIIGFFFLFLGVNSLIISLAMRRNRSNPSKSWSFGGYEIIKKK